MSDQNSLFLSSPLLARLSPYDVAYFCHVAAYTLALSGPILHMAGANQDFLVPFHFGVMVAGAAIAFVKLLKGEHHAVWALRKGA